MHVNASKILFICGDSYCVLHLSADLCDELFGLMAQMYDQYKTKIEIVDEQLQLKDNLNF